MLNACGPDDPREPRVLVAGMGTVLRKDDGFGVAVVRHLMETWRPRPANVTLVDCGAAGISLVQELLDGYDALIVVDAVRRHGRPGTIYVLEPRVQALMERDDSLRQASLTDAHLMEPGQVFAVAHGLGVLPPYVRVVGCEPAEVDEAEIGLSASLQHALRPAAHRVRALAEELVAPPRSGSSSE